MDQDSIQQIAQEIARHLLDYSLPLLALQVVLVMIAFAGGVLFGEYRRRREKAEPPGHSVPLQGRTTAPTSEGEALGHEVPGHQAARHEGPRHDAPGQDVFAHDGLGHEDWRMREWAHLRRTKLEALLTKMHDCEHLAGQSAAPQPPRADQRDLMSELEVITTLYFPELKIEVDEFVRQCRARSEAEIGKARAQLSTAAQILTAEIMGIGDHAPRQPLLN